MPLLNLLAQAPLVLKSIVGQFGIVQLWRCRQVCRLLKRFCEAALADLPTVSVLGQERSPTEKMPAKLISESFSFALSDWGLSSWENRSSQPSAVIESTQCTIRVPVFEWRKVRCREWSTAGWVKDTAWRDSPVSCFAGAAYSTLHNEADFTFVCGGRTQFPDADAERRRNLGQQESGEDHFATTGKRALIVDRDSSWVGPDMPVARQWHRAVLLQGESSKVIVLGGCCLADLAIGETVILLALSLCVAIETPANGRGGLLTSPLHHY